MQINSPYISLILASKSSEREVFWRFTTRNLEEKIKDWGKGGTQLPELKNKKRLSVYELFWIKPNTVFGT